MMESPSRVPLALLPAAAPYTPPKPTPVDPELLHFRISASPLTPLDCACMGYYHFNHKVWVDGSGWQLRNDFMNIIERAQKLYKVCSRSECRACFPIFFAFITSTTWNEELEQTR